MSKELWVEEYERLEAENEGLDDATLSDMAMDAVMNKLAWMADSRRDRPSTKTHRWCCVRV